MTGEQAQLQEISVKAVIVTGGQVLIGRKAHPPYQWELPGGRIDTGEHPETALARELREELGVQLTGPAQLHTVGPADPLAGYAPLFYVVYRVDLDGQTPRMSDEHVRLEYVSRPDVVELAAKQQFNPALGRMLLAQWPGGR
jgi:8-oxo-dGTP diphosphatase